MTQSSPREPSLLRRAVTMSLQAVLGPWPLLPVVSAVLLTLVLIYQNMQLAVTVAAAPCRLWCVRPWPLIAPLSIDGANAPLVDIASVLVNAVLAGAGVGLVLWCFRRWWSPLAPGSIWPARLRYVVALIAAAAIGGYLRMFALSPLAALNPGPQAVQSTARRILFCLALVHLIVGLATRRYAEQVHRTDAALATVQRQQVLVLTADERSRREAASFLHDRVQADLLLVALKLRAGMAGATPAAQQELAGAIEDPERIRDQDVRGTSRRLSPDLDSMGIDLALADLAHSWRTAMTVDIVFDPGARRRLVQAGIPAEVLSALYRICEQALLNAAAHGHARNVTISCTLRGRAEGQPESVLVTVTDDGRGPRGGPPGTGSAISDAWCSVVGGHWRLEGTGTGAQVTAVIPLLASSAAAGLPVAGEYPHPYAG